MTEKNKITTHYYTPDTIISRGSPINAVIGARSIGKTEGFKNHFVKRFVKYGEQFVFTRRYADDFDTMLDFWKVQRKLFPDYKFGIRIHKKILVATINELDAGYLLAVNTAQKYKSGFSYDDVRWFVYDEFLADGNTYAAKESFKLMSLIWTVKRDKPVDSFQAFMLGNSVEKQNPHFQYFNMHVDTSKRFTSHPDNLWSIENIDSDTIGILQEIKEDAWGAFAASTPYGEYALDNKFSDDNDALIRTRAEDANQIGLLIYEGEYLGVWYSTITDTVWIDKKHNKHSNRRIALTAKDLDEGISYKKDIDQSFTYILTQARSKGLMFFTSQEARSKGQEILSKIGIY